MATVPTSPFCSLADIAHYNPIRFNQAGTIADGKTVPGATPANLFIECVSAEILSRFRLAGYTTPLTSDGSGAWTDEQTTYLRLLCILGVGGMIASPVHSNPGRRGSDSNPFEVRYRAGLDTIYSISEKEAGPFLGITYRLGTPAVKAVTAPAVPTTSWLLGMNDPARHASFAYWTKKSQEMQDYLESLPLYHNYDYDLNDQQAGPTYV